MSAPDWIKVGEQVVVMNGDRAEPREATISQVTASRHQFYLDGYGAKRFRIRKGNDYADPVGMPNIMVYPHRDLKRLTDAYEHRKQEAEKHDNIQRLKREAAEHDARKALVDPHMHWVWTYKLGDKTVRVFDIPVNPEYADRKGERELVTVVLFELPTNHWAYAPETPWQAYANTINNRRAGGNNHTGYTGYHATQEEAIWAALIDAYNSL